MLSTIGRHRVVTYYELADDRRLDCVAIDSAGDGTEVSADDVVVAIEAECPNHDQRRAIPADYDAMAACDPDEAVWLVPGRGGAMAVVDALHDPAEGDPRIDKTYGETTAPQDYRIDTPGCTAVRTVTAWRDALERTGLE